MKKQDAVRLNPAYAEKIKPFNRRDLYIVSYREERTFTFPVESKKVVALMHFYKYNIVFKVLAPIKVWHPLLEKEKFLKVSYKRIDHYKFERCPVTELPRYLANATDHMAEVFKKGLDKWNVK